MTLMADHPVRPWGLGRMAPISPSEPEYHSIAFDSTTQLTHFYDASGAIVDMQRGTVTLSPSGSGSDGSNGPRVADDSND